MVSFGPTYRLLPDHGGLETRSARWREPARWNHDTETLDLGDRTVSYDRCAVMLLPPAEMSVSRYFDSGSSRGFLSLSHRHLDPGAVSSTLRPNRFDQMRARDAVVQRNRDVRRGMGGGLSRHRSKGRVMLTIDDDGWKRLYQGDAAQEIVDDLQAAGVRVERLVI